LNALSSYEGKFRGLEEKFKNNYETSYKKSTQETYYSQKPPNKKPLKGRFEFMTSRNNLREEKRSTGSGSGSGSAPKNTHNEYVSKKHFSILKNLLEVNATALGE